MWEYRFLNIIVDSHEIEVLLNIRGQKGWELVSASTVPSKKQMEKLEFTAFFKRKKSI